MVTMPALFIGHGSPMNTLETNGYTEAWQAFGRHLPRPRAVLVVSAHWFFGATAVTAMARPRTIHDFYGFPQALFDFDYAAPGDPDLAGEIAELAKPRWVGLDRDQWGLDHGAWSVLTHMYPEADVPVIQLSINALQSLEYHLELAARLGRPRERGHNLKRVQWDQTDAAYDWAGARSVEPETGDGRLHHRLGIDALTGLGGGAGRHHQRQQMFLLRVRQAPRGCIRPARKRVGPRAVR
jgi:4,5-DOPA dioxygenase extradiol